jgi:hypothetical protein
MPRPARPVRAAVSAAVLQRAAAYVLDVALQCTPRGGQVLVSAQRLGAGGAAGARVVVAIMHTGRMSPARLHTRSPALAPPGADGAASSGLVSLDFAQQLVEGAGGSLRVAYPCSLVNAASGLTEAATAAELCFDGFA